MTTAPPKPQGVPKGPLTYHEPRDGKRKPQEPPKVTHEQVREYVKQETGQ
jgi:hypothetical protein